MLSDNQTLQTVVIEYIVHWILNGNN